ncbi:hypothetical protein HYS00_04215 [Candidatus Microgenomates bacterium]|nr:hypothetical protein [Candidatus Microgenomates bacterium]
MKKSVGIQLVPIILTFIVFFLISLVLLGVIVVLNTFTKTDIVLKLRWSDIIIGMTIYLKTSVDFAILIGNLMARYEGVKNRIAIEVGTAVGNGLGTIIVLTIWNFFRDVQWLLALMIFVAALVLFKLAEEGIEHTEDSEKPLPAWLRPIVAAVKSWLTVLNKALSPILRYVVPNVSMRPKKNLTFWGLFVASFTIPFILGLDDFAGYVPLFSIVNVFGFSVGVFLGHMLLNLALFVSPKRTITVVKNPYISFAGSLAFIGLAVWGLFEVAKILLLHH